LPPAKDIAIIATRVMIPPNEALTGDPTSAGPGMHMAMMDMSRCAFFVYVDLDGNAYAQAEGVSKTQAAEWTRRLADIWAKADREDEPPEARP
jgi:hypothetical protein